MKIRHIVLSLAALIFFAIIVSFLFALYTEAGTSLVIKAVRSAAPDAIDVAQVTGRVGYRLHIEGLTLRVSGNTVRVASTDLQWHPVYLAVGKLPIEKLKLKDVTITGARKEKKPVDLGLPRLSRWTSVFRAFINHLSIEGLVYTAPGSKPVSVHALTAGILLDRGVLYLDGLNVKSGLVDIGGTIILNLVHPGLRAALNGSLHEKALGFDTISLSADLPASHGKEQVAGVVVLKAFAGKKERLRFECSIGLQRQAVRVTDARLTKADNGGALAANAAIDLSGSKPAFDISGKLVKLDLAPELPQGTSLSGDFHAAGSTDDFEGGISLGNAGPYWKDMAICVSIIGTKEAIRLRDLEAKIMGGTMLGSAELAKASRTVSFKVTGTGFNPAKIERALSGNINFRLNGRFEIPGDGPVGWSIKADVYNSTFQKRPLTADVDAALSNELIKINSLSARGNGFSLNARGTVQERVALLVRIDDAAKIWPGTTGTLAAHGWTRWRDNEFAGALTAHGSNIALGTLLVRSFDADIKMPEGYDGPVAVGITANKFSYGVIKGDAVNLTVNGTMDDHTISFVNTHAKDRIEAFARGAYSDGAWEGTLVRMSGREALYGNFDLQKPSTVRIASDGVSLSPFVIAGPGSEMLKLNARLKFDPLIGSVDAEWRNINLGRANKAMGNARLEGHTSGNSRVEWLKNDRLIIKGTFTGTAAYSHGPIKQLKADIDSRIDWNASGLNGTLNVDLGNRGRLDAAVSSKEPARFSMPRHGTFQGKWSKLDLAVLQPILGNTVNLKGYLSGNVKGNFLPENRFSLNGNSSLAEGSFAWLADQTEIAAPIREAAVNMKWDGSSIRGSTRIVLGQFGNARADFRLPLPARFPLMMDTSGPLLFSANGEMNERGLITALFPGMAQETKGQIGFDIAATGTTADPWLNGRLSLKKASAYLPSAGMDLKDVNAEMAFNRDRITISHFAARSGPGQINVRGSASHSGGKISGFEATVRGNRFQAVRLPELTMLVSPDINIRGDTKRVVVRGSVLIPEALVREQQKEDLVKSSPDVVIVGQEEAHEKLPFELDLLVAVRMGDKVAIKAYGIDTRLTGAVDISMAGPEDIRVRGAIKTQEGKYDAYGVRLNVRRGNVSFGGGPVKNANLDILALRRIQEPDKGVVQAGVLVTGTPDKPAVKLYSQPAMQDMDILSYIVLGRPGGPGGQGDTALLARAASGLLAGSRSSALQKALGLDVDVEQQGTSATQSIIKVGKYLSPKLYVGFGRSMAVGENVFSLRYRLTRKLDIESTVGNQTGGTIYYRMEFD